MTLPYSIPEITIMLLLGGSFSLLVCAILLVNSRQRKMLSEHLAEQEELGKRLENLSRRLETLETERREVRKLLAETGGGSQQDLIQRLMHRLEESESRLMKSENQMRQNDRLLNEMLQALS